MAADSSSPASIADGPLAVVTGANTGVGFHVAGLLAKGGYNVILACRSEERAQEAIGRLHQLYGPDVKVQFKKLDLASFSSVCSFAADMSSSGHTAGLQLLVCNAGLNSASVSHAPEEQLTSDGVDVLYQTNFLSHFLLIDLLIPMLRTARGRVVSITSIVHRSADTSHLSLVRKVRDPYLSLYGFSKLAQIAIGFELHRRCPEVAFHCVNPGGVASDIWRNYPAWQRWAFPIVLARPERVAGTVVQACIFEEGAAPAPPKHLNGYMGASRLSIFEYWSPWSAGKRLVPSEPSDDARNSEFARQLWDESCAALHAAGFQVSLDSATGNGDCHTSD